MNLRISGSPAIAAFAPLRMADRDRERDVSFGTSTSRQAERGMALPSRIGLAFAAAFIVAPSIASAIPLEYSFVNASTTLNGATEQITGLFGFDSDNQNLALGPPGCCTQNGAQFTLTGPAPYAGIYFHGFEEAIAPNEIIGDNPNAQAFLFITFANDLSVSAAVDPLTSVIWEPSGAEFVFDRSPTGFAACGGTVFPSPFESCAAALPEPASLGLLGIALGLLCAIRPVRRYLDSGRVLNPIRPETPTPERALTL
jgi:hypothetical protein